MEIKGFKNVEYWQFVTLMGVANAEYIDNGGNELKLADAIGVKAVQTVRNCFNPDGQKVADDTITTLMKEIGFNGAILWKDGERTYFVKGK